ncbi:tRNA 5-methylaminomethyl-2-thiouridine synthase [Bradyrhizobium sp. BRP22]|uniref:DUF6894 family protein n=1 Tax=Bradyrhizobium sp. BRP22 TaxID=2793821 RepID=UPI001CD35D83|nr:tRNA 5-methylaminomethyl-2-thiouridine synthase [Bradyrhizobium sp. BRP22]MCA1453878.1 tRNA 5-methylaminomethyl-2-thiouridine synthase [Bradyrhizobium sp. BRP22]
MHTYQFHIGGPRPFHDVEGMDLPDAGTAWGEALRLVRDIEGWLQPGDAWSLDVVEDGTTIFHITLATADCGSGAGSASAKRLDQRLFGSR